MKKMRMVRAADAEALRKILQLQNIKTVYGGVTVPTPASEALHDAFGFQRQGTYHRTGYKCGSWHDVAWFEKQVGEYGAAPMDILSVQRLDCREVQKILEACSLRMRKETR